MTTVSSYAKGPFATYFCDLQLKLFGVDVADGPSRIHSATVSVPNLISL